MNVFDEVPNVETSRGVSMTEYRVSGTLGAVLDFIAAMMEKRHPAGYGTRVHAIEWASNGQYVARVSHANSCD